MRTGLHPCSLLFTCLWLLKHSHWCPSLCISRASVFTAQKIQSALVRSSSVFFSLLSSPLLLFVFVLNGYREALSLRLTGCHPRTTFFFFCQLSGDLYCFVPVFYHSWSITVWVLSTGINDPEFMSISKVEQGDRLLPNEKREFTFFGAWKRCGGGSDTKDFTRLQIMHSVSDLDEKMLLK